jgi:hypothetical protein
MMNAASSYRVLLSAVLVSVIALGLGCASRQSKSDGKTGATSEGFDSKTDAFEVPERKSGSEQRDTSAASSDSRVADSILKPAKAARIPKTIYRVQLFASQYYSEAVLERDVANDVFDEPVFLFYDSPYYKVSVGNCVQRKEGEALLGRARTLGYKDSWLTEGAPDSLYFDSPRKPDISPPSVPSTQEKDTPSRH